MSFPDSVMQVCSFGMLDSAPRPLTDIAIEELWQIFVAINRRWKLFHTRDPEHPMHDASNLRSTWLEFVRLRADPPQWPGAPWNPPRYAAEYENARGVVDALIAAGDKDAHDTLLVVNCADPAHRREHWVDPCSRLGHAKRFVVDEFMTVMIVASGFKEFGGRNYNGFVGGSRFDRATEIRKPFRLPEGGGALTVTDDVEYVLIGSGRRGLLGRAAPSRGRPEHLDPDARGGRKDPRQGSSPVVGLRGQPSRTLRVDL